MQMIPTWNCQKAELEMTNLCGRAMVKTVYHAHILKFILVEVNDSTSKNNFDKILKLKKSIEKSIKIMFYCI